ncbi:mCG1039271, partial [Mus musculus]
CSPHLGESNGPLLEHHRLEMLTDQFQCSIHVLSLLRMKKKYLVK